MPASKACSCGDEGRPWLKDEAAVRGLRVGGLNEGGCSKVHITRRSVRCIRSLLSSPCGAYMSQTCKSVVARADERQREGWSDEERGNASWFTLFSGDITPTAAMSAGIMEIPPDKGSLEPHRHRQAEIYFVLEGAGLLTVDGVESTITAGTAAFIPGDAEHSVINPSASVLRIFYVFPTDSFADVVYRFSGSPQSH